MRILFFVILSLGAISAVMGMTNTEASVETIERPYLGLHITALDPVGVRVGEVVRNSPAEQAGLQAGDAIFAINDEYIDSSGFLDALYEYQPEDTITLTLIRAGRQHQIDVTLKPQPTMVKRSTLAMAVHNEDVANVQYNVEAKALALADINANSPLYSVGLRTGDHITAINNHPLDVQTINNLMARNLFDSVAYLTIVRDGQHIELEIPAEWAQVLMFNASVVPHVP